MTNNTTAPAEASTSTANTLSPAVVKFTGRHCRSPSTSHKEYEGQWMGMGLIAICDCDCHNHHHHQLYNNHSHKSKNATGGSPSQ